VPTSVVITSTAAYVKEYCRKLIEDCGEGGGYILTAEPALIKATLKICGLMMEAAYEYVCTALIRFVARYFRKREDLSLSFL